MPQSTRAHIDLGRRCQELIDVVPSDSFGHDLVFAIRDDSLLLVEAYLEISVGDCRYR